MAASSDVNCPRSYNTRVMGTASAANIAVAGRATAASNDKPASACRLNVSVRPDPCAAESSVSSTVYTGTAVKLTGSKKTRNAYANAEMLPSSSVEASARATNALIGTTAVATRAPIAKPPISRSAGCVTAPQTADGRNRIPSRAKAGTCASTCTTLPATTPIARLVIPYVGARPSAQAIITRLNSTPAYSGMA